MSDPATTTLLIHGASGRMGRAITALATKAEGVSVRGFLELRRGAESRSSFAGGYPVFDRLPDGDLSGVVGVDFSRPRAVAPLTEALAASGLRLVCGTTGLGDRERDLLEAYSEECAVFYDENMSYGISVLKYILGDSAPRLRGMDVEIVEYHHRGKRDAPSGTALSLARALARGSGTLAERGGSEPDADAIHIHSVRAGDIPGEHQVIFASGGEVLTLSHRALSRDVFARGAIRAARFIAGKEKGMHSMEDLIRDETK